LYQIEKRRPEMLEHRKKARNSKLLNSIVAAFGVSEM
jgi:hypothetical protein